MIAPVTHVLPLTMIRRERLLPVTGHVLVRKGQKVNSADVLAEANLTPQHVLLDVARGLGITAKRADEHIQRNTGEMVSEGDIIAGPVGWVSRVVRAPCSGKVIRTGKGKVLLEIESPPFQLKAGMPGVVASLVAERGAIVETSGALVQGVWGNGGIDSGLLHVLINRPEDVLTADRLGGSLRGGVVLAGFCGDAGVIQAAAELPLRGLILASMAASLVPLATQTPFPIMVLEGFGLLAMNLVAFNILTANERREVALNAQPYDPYANTRPEVIIPLPVSENPPEPQEGAVFSLNQRVRVLRAPSHSQVGTIIALPSSVVLFPSGIRSLAAQVRLENGKDAFFPLANLEVLE